MKMKTNRLHFSLIVQHQWMVSLVYNLVYGLLYILVVDCIALTYSC